jgi:hypothetical protein
MKDRCLNPGQKHYPHYGGRGITVCDRWKLDFLPFLADVGERPSPRHSLDRINVDGNYEPGNVRWATQAQQARNKRDNRTVTWQGQTLTVTDWARITGIHRNTLDARIRDGWPLEKAFRKCRYSNSGRIISA